VSEVIIVRN